jgi:peptidyl-prolyl cis-trans isomerase B (cyclophilin B)
MLRKSYIIILFAIMILSVTSCKAVSQKNESGSKADLADYQLQTPQDGDTIAEFTTSMGVFKVKLFPEEAPKTVENFTTHAKNGYYDGVTFHRVIDDFMIQSGDPLGDGTGGESIWRTPFKDEFSPRLFNYRGALSMANSGANTNGSQFFVVQKSTINDKELQYLKYMQYPDEVTKKYQQLGGTMWLDNEHSVFGQVYEGMDIVDKIAAAPTDDDDKPTESILIESIKIQIFGQ